MSGRYTRGREHEVVANPLISPRKADVKRKSDQESVRRGGSSEAQPTPNTHKAAWL